MDYTNISFTNNDLRVDGLANNTGISVAILAQV